MAEEITPSAPASPRVKPSWSNTSYWKGEVTRVLAQEEYVRANVVKGVADKMNYIKDIFKNVVFNDAKLTFIDMNAPEQYRKEKPLKELKTPRFKPFKALPDKEKANVAAYVDVILSKRRDAEQNLEQWRINEETERIVDAMRQRQKMEYINQDVIAMMDSICGILPFDEKYHFRISVDPVDVFMKSTGQTWSQISCESTHGSRPHGPAADIALYNAVAFLEDSSGKTIARLMIRWCNPQNTTRKNDIGIEAAVYGGINNKVYLTDISNRRTTLVPGLYGYDVYRSLYTQLRQQGFLDYTECITPYRYAGYSDIMTDDYKKIIFHKYDYPLKYSGAQATKLEALLESSDLEKARAIREDWRKPKDSRELSESDVLEILNSMSRNIVKLAATEGPDILTAYILSHFSFDVLVEITAGSAFMDMISSNPGLQGSQQSDLAILINKGIRDQPVNAKDYSTDFFVKVLFVTKDMQWHFNIMNYAYIAVAAIKWFLDIASIACPGRMETGVCSVALQILMRNFNTVPLLLPQLTVGKLIKTNKVSVIGALLAYLATAIQVYPSSESVKKKNLGIQFDRVSEKYAALYVYSQTIIDEWFSSPHDVTVECGACGTDEMTGEPKRFTITEKKTGNSMKITLCSQCATKIFIVYCEDEKKYARRLRLVHAYYAKRNFAPESYCETFESSYPYKKGRVEKSGQELLERKAKQYFKVHGYIERYNIDYMGKWNLEKEKRKKK